MKKNSQKLVMCIIGVILALCISIFYGPKAKRNQNVSLDFADGNQLTYTVASSDEETIRKTAEVLDKRIRRYGAADTDYIINGSDIVISFTGVEDVEAMRSNITRKGELTMRNSDNELIMDASVLNANAPIALSKSDDNTVLVLNVADEDTFYEKTANQAAATNKFMILWVDFNEASDSYATESAKTNPSYLAAASVTSGIRGSCYINTHHTYDDAFKQVVLVYSGALPAEIKETSFNEITSKYGSFDTVWTVTLVASLLAGAVLAYEFGIAALPTALMLLVNAVLFCNFTALLGGAFDSFQLMAYILSAAVALFMMYQILKEFKNGLLRGRNLQVSLDNAFNANARSMWETAVAHIALGALGFLFTGNDMRRFAGSAVIGGICNLVLYVLWNRLMLSDMVASGLFTDLKLYRVNPAELPDVEKGENYQEKPGLFKFDFAGILKGNVPYIVFGVAVAALLLLTGFAGRDLVIKVLIIAAVFTALVTVYVGFAYKSHYAYMPLMLVAVACALSVVAVVFRDSRYAGIILCGCALAVAMLFKLISVLRGEFRTISREKLNDDKVSKFVNSQLNSFSDGFCRSAVAVLVLRIIVSVVSKNFIICVVTVLAIAVVYIAAVLLAGKFWLNETKKYMARKPKKSNRKKGKKERSETVIFGLNEVK